jgi:hypothetical protein
MKASKKLGPKDRALVILRGGLLYWKFLDLLKFQITNPKKQTNYNDQNSKIQTMPRHGRFRSLNIGICDLFVIWSLEFVILYTKSKAEPSISGIGQRTRFFKAK